MGGNWNTFSKEILHTHTHVHARAHTHTTIEPVSTIQKTLVPVLYLQEKEENFKNTVQDGLWSLNLTKHPFFIGESLDTALSNLLQTGWILSSFGLPLGHIIESTRKGPVPEACPVCCCLPTPRGKNQKQGSLELPWTNSRKWEWREDSVGTQATVKWRKEDKNQQNQEAGGKLEAK